MDIAALAAACAPNVHPITMAAVVRVESAGRAVALNVNRLAGRQPSAGDAAEAARLARLYVGQGYSVDIGLAQVNSRNLPGLGLTVEQVLEPCTNLRAGQAILADCYARAVGALGAEGQPALRSALSCYNTGTLTRGFRNGYVARYVPALRAGPPTLGSGASAGRDAGAAQPIAAAVPAPPPAWGGVRDLPWGEVARGGRPAAGAAAQTAWISASAWTPDR